MKLKVIGNTNRPVDLKYSLDGTTFIDTTLADLQQGIPLPDDQDYSQVKVKMNSTVMGALDIIKNIGIEAKTFKVAAGVYGENKCPRGNVLHSVNKHYSINSIPFNYNDILDTYRINCNNSWTSYDTIEGEGGTYLFLRDSDFFTNYADNDYDQYKMCGGELERNNGRIELYQATHSNMDIVFHNIETNTFSPYIHITDENVNNIHNKYDVYLVKYDYEVDYKEIPVDEEIPDGWGLQNHYTIYLDEDGNVLTSSYNYWGEKADLAVSSMDVNLISKYGDYIYLPICKVGNLDVNQDYTIYRDAPVTNDFDGIVDPQNYD